MRNFRKGLLEGVGSINKVKRISFLGIMLAIIMVLGILEHMIPPLPLMPPSVKLGLSNIVTMYCVFFVGKKEAVLLAVLKSCFVFLIRGAMAGGLSLCGGLLSLAVILLLDRTFKQKISYTILSISGAISHNIGQLLAVSVILNSNFIFYYLPVLLVSGIVMGIITGTLLKVVMPVFNNILK